ALPIYVIVHTDKAPATTLQDWQSRAQGAGLIEMARFGPTVAYQVANSPNCRSQLSDLTLGSQVAKIAEPGKQFRFLLSVYSPRDCWVDGHLSQAKEIEGEWIDEDSGNVVRFATSVGWPLVLGAEESKWVWPPPKSHRQEHIVFILCPWITPSWGYRSKR